MPDLPDWFNQGIVTEVVGWVVTGLVAQAIGYCIKWASERTSVGIPLKLAVVAGFAFLGTSIAYLTGHWSLVFATVAAAAALLWFALKGMFRIGLIDAFETTRKGISYSSSLNLSHESIAFLGIGAHKLTSDPGFEDAIRRCSHGGGTARFLLSHPTNDLLEKLARRNGSPDDRYQKNVQDSLKTLAHLKIAKSLNIEVKFYPEEHRKDFQQFRLMIINQSICLFSWTVWDEREGAGNPQVILKQSRVPRHQKSTLFKAFNDYFEELWEASTPAQMEDYK